nr:hypothetical protein [Tanacetum cinerariifolium]
MVMTIDQQVSFDEALVPHASRLRIGKIKFRLRSDVTSKESTLQLVYDVLRLTPFYKTFLVTADVPEIYMQEFWATVTTFDELPFEEEILEFLRYLGYSGEIRKITDSSVISGSDSLGNVPQEERTFCLPSVGSFVYQVEQKDAKKSNEMYYPRFTKVIIHFFMTKDPSIPKRNKVNWHYFRDDQMFTTIKLVSRHQNTQQFGAILPIELTNEDIRNSAAYNEYYAIASGAAPPKTKASVRKTQSSSDTTITPPTAAGTRLSTLAKGKQPAKSSKAKGSSVLSEVAMIEAEQMKLATKRSLQQIHISQASGLGTYEGTCILPGVLDVPTDESDEEIYWKSSDEVDDRNDDQEDEDDQDDDNDDQDTDNDGDDFVHPKLSIHEEEAKDEESFDPIIQTPKNSNNEGNDDASLGRDVQMTDVHITQEFDDTHVTLTPVNLDGQQQSSSVSSQFVTSMLNPSPDAGIDSLFESTPRVDVQASTTVAPLTLIAPTLPPLTIPTISQVPQAPTPPTTAPSTFLQDLPNFVSLFGFDHRLKTLEANFSKFVQTNQFAGAVSSIPGIVERYMDQRMNKAVKVAVQIQSDRLRDETQAENEDLINILDANIQKIVKEQVNEQVKKILIEKMESNKSIHRSVEQRNLYKALVDAYECDKIILDIYGDTVTLKRRRDDTDKDEEPSAGSDRGSKRRREGKSQSQQALQRKRRPRPLASLLKGPNLIKDCKRHPEWFQKQKKPPTPDRSWNKTLPATHRSIQPWISDLAKQADSRSSFNELMDTPVDFSAFLMHRLKSLVELEFFLEEVYKATTDQLDWNNPEGQQYPHNLLKPLPLIPNSRGRRVIPFDHFINNDLKYLRGGAFSRKYTTFVTKTKATDYGHIKWIEDLVPRTMWSQEPISYDKYALWWISHWDANVNSSTDLQSTGSLLEMSTQNVESSLSPNFRSKADKSHGRRTLCFQRLSKNVHEKHHHPTACGRSSTSDGTLNDVRTALDNRLKEPEGSTQGYPLVSVEVLRYDKRSKGENMGIVSTVMGLILEQTQQGISHEVSMIHTEAGNPVKEILLKLNLPDHRTLKDGGEGWSVFIPGTCKYLIFQYGYAIEFPNPNAVPTHMGRPNLQTTIETHHDVDGIFDQNILNRGKKEQFPRKYKLTSFMEQPPTTILPKQRVNKTKNKGKNANLAPLNLGGAFEDDNVEENNVTFLGSQFDGNFLIYENVDPTKHMNSWMELLIRRRNAKANWTVAYTGTISVHPENNRFIIPTDQHVIGTLDGTTRPYPAWNDVDWVFMPIHVVGNHWATGVIHLPNSYFYVFDSMYNEQNKDVLS